MSKFLSYNDIDIRTYDRFMSMPHLLDLEEDFSRNSDAILVNRVTFTEDDLSATINNQVFNTLADKAIGFVATCDCGELKGNMYLGATCNICNTKVKSGFMSNITSNSWIGVPDGIKAFIHPTVYCILAKWLSIGRPTANNRENNYIDIILNPALELPDELTTIVTDRGFNYFYDNFDNLMQYFTELHPRIKKHKSTPMIKHFLWKYRHLVFTTKLPITNRTLHPLTRESDTLLYGDENTKLILNTITDLCNLTLTNSTIGKSTKKTNRVVYRCYQQHIDYLLTIVASKLAEKEAMPRSHLLGTRTHFSMRTVITPITGEHRLDEIHTPWGASINTYKHQLISTLTQYHGFTVLSAVRYLQSKMETYDTLIHSIFKEAIETYQCPWPDPRDPNKWITVKPGGLPVLLHRNPTMSRNAFTLMYITKVKAGKDGMGMTDETSPEMVSVKDTTISIPHPMVPGMNADFDGDENNVLPILEANVVHKFKTFSLPYHILDTGKVPINNMIQFHDTLLQQLNSRMTDNNIVLLDHDTSWYKGAVAC